MVSILKLVFELQPLFDVVVTKVWKIDYTLGGGKMHGEQIEISLNFVHPCIGKLCVQISLFAWSAIQCCISVMAQLEMLKLGQFIHLSM